MPVPADLFYPGWGHPEEWYCSLFTPAGFRNFPLIISHAIRKSRPDCGFFAWLIFGIIPPAGTFYDEIRKGNGEGQGLLSCHRRIP